MNRKNLTRIRRDEAGVALVEILASAVILIIAAVGVFTAFDASTRATAQERHRARANALAEQDLERMRAMRIADLSTLNQTRTVTADGTVYTIVSRSQFLTENATTSTCASGTGSRDYLQISSTVTWPSMGGRPAVTAASIVSPPSGSVVPNSGSLLVQVNDSRSVGVPGVTLSGSGAGSFTGTTGSTGCVLWRNLPAGNYSMSASGAASGMVDNDGNPPASQTVSVVDQSTNTIQLQYDRPGSLAVNFKTRPYGNGAVVNSSVDGITVFNTGMTTAKTFVPPGAPGTRATTITTTSTLFPFTSSYAVYGGTCANNNPDPTGIGANPAAIGNVTVPIGGAGNLAPGYITLPALHLTVQDGKDSSTPGNAVSGAHVTVKDLGANCGAVTRTMTTNTVGQLTDPGLPYGNYEVCADAFFSTKQRKNYVRSGSNAEAVPVTDPNAGAVRTIYLGNSATGLTTGNTTSSPVCP